jgi:transcriptional regulator of acetoin/glycerol metabolism
MRRQGVLGILDVSTSARLTQVHAQALLQTTAEIIENRLIETVADAAVVIRFHHQPEALASPSKALPYSTKGRLPGLQPARRTPSGPERHAHPAAPFWEIFETRWNALLDHALQSSARPRPCAVTSVGSSSPACW